jgi:hypothetical protein
LSTAERKRGLVAPSYNDGLLEVRGQLPRSLQVVQVLQGRGLWWGHVMVMMAMVTMNGHRHVTTDTVGWGCRREAWWMTIMLQSESCVPLSMSPQSHCCTAHWIPCVPQLEGLMDV